MSRLGFIAITNTAQEKHMNRGPIELYYRPTPNGFSKPAGLIPVAEHGEAIHSDASSRS
jgi:hypothetical protein